MGNSNSDGLHNQQQWMMCFLTLSWSWSVRKFRWFPLLKNDHPTKNEPITLSSINCLESHVFNPISKILNTTKLSTLINAVGRVNHNEPRILHGWHCGYRYPCFDRRSRIMVKLCSAEPQRTQNTAISFWLLAYQKSSISRRFASPYLPSPQKSYCKKKKLQLSHLKPLTSSSSIGNFHVNNVYSSKGHRRQWLDPLSNSIRAHPPSSWHHEVYVNPNVPRAWEIFWMEGFHFFLQGSSGSFPFQTSTGRRIKKFTQKPIKTRWKTSTSRDHLKQSTTSRNTSQHQQEKCTQNQSESISTSTKIQAPGSNYPHYTPLINMAMGNGSVQKNRFPAFREGVTGFAILIHFWYNLRVWSVGLFPGGWTQLIMRIIWIFSPEFLLSLSEVSWFYPLR